MADLRLSVVGRGGVEPPTFHFSGGRSYQLSYLPPFAFVHANAWNHTWPECVASSLSALGGRSTANGSVTSSRCLRNR